MDQNTDLHLVTGADGFIGSHLVETLLSQGKKVRALCLYNSIGHLGWLEGIKHENLEIILGDIRDPEICKNLVTDVSTVFNLAALISIPYSYQGPYNFIDTNVSGGMHLALAASREPKIRAFVQTSTSEVYGTAITVPISESHPLQPQSPYSGSKIASDAMVMSIHHSNNLPVILARPFNTYGPRQSARAVIPAIMCQILSGAKVIKVGDLSPTRDFNFVEDTVAGLIQLSECSQAIGQAVNIGSGIEYSISETFELIAKACESDVKFEIENERIRPEGSEVFRLLCDNTKIKGLTGFTSKFSLVNGLKKTVEWMKKPEHLSFYKGDTYLK
jgi:NAD dependent epimerase/dehydratase